MRLYKLIKFLYTAVHPHFLSVDKSTYKKYKYLVLIAVKLNKNYKSCEIFRKKYKNMENFVVIGLKYNGRNVKRRTSGFAKEYLVNNPGEKCLYCEKNLTDKNATTDHIIPISEAGNNSQVNLIVCCKDCNNDRGNMDFKTYLMIKNRKYTTGKVFL